MDIGLKRLVLILLSIAGGIAGTFGILLLINLAYHANVTPARYGTGYMILTAIPLSLLFGVWLDAFMKTKILETQIPEEK